MEAKDAVSSGLPDPCVLLGGQPRSGTTLLSAILRATPGHLQAFEMHMRKPSFLVGLDGRYTRNIFKGIGLPPEVYDDLVARIDRRGMNLGAWVGPKEDVSAEPLTGLETPHFEAELAARAHAVTLLMREAARIAGASTWGMKILGDIAYADTYRKAWPNAKFILLIRDPRDQALSIMRLNDQRQQRGQPNFYDDFREAARGWRDTLQSAKEVLRRCGIPHIEVRYEDLVAEPEATAKRLGDFLNMDVSAGLRFQQLEFVESHTKRFRHHDNLHNPINTQSVGKWRDAMSHHDAQIFREVAGDLMKDLGYA